MHLHIYLVCLICSIPFMGWTTQLDPWFGNPYELKWRNSFAYQTYKYVDKDGSLMRHCSDDYFLYTSLSTFLEDDYGIEAEVLLADTRKHYFSFDSAKITGRYFIYDDVAGDPISLVVGASVIQAVAISLHDMSSFHHGKLEGELHLSFGREVACGLNWDFRWWVLGAIGSADVGRPWWRAKLTCEQRLSECQELAIFVNILEGLGSKSLDSCHFRGYGNIRHKSVDVGFIYTYSIDFVGQIHLKYLNRIYARNFPAHANVVALSFDFFFGL